IPTRRQKEGFYPPLPVRVAVAVVAAKATKALPLILAIHRQLHMTKRRETPLNGAIWDAAGNPSPREKAAIIRKLKAVAEIIPLTTKQTSTSSYWVSKGSLWSREAGM